MSRSAPTTRHCHSLSRRVAKGAGIATLLALAACSGTDKPDEPKQPADNYVPPCPQVQILRDASGVTLFGGNQAEPAVIARAAFGTFGGSCVYDRDDNTVQVEVDVNVLAERGPAGGAFPSVTVPYFVAVVGPDQQVLAKQEFAATLAFDENGQAQVTEELEQIVPLAGGLAAGPAYQVMLGFQLSPEQLEFNRRNLSRALGTP